MLQRIDCRSDRLETTSEHVYAKKYYTLTSVNYRTDYIMMIDRKKNNLYKNNLFMRVYKYI